MIFLSHHANINMFHETYNKKIGLKELKVKQESLHLSIWLPCYIHRLLVSILFTLLITIIHYYILFTDLMQLTAPYTNMHVHKCESESWSRGQMIWNGFGKKLGRVNTNRIFIFGCSNPIMLLPCVDFLSEGLILIRV